MKTKLYMLLAALILTMAVPLSYNAVRADEHHWAGPEGETPVKPEVPKEKMTTEERLLLLNAVAHYWKDAKRPEAGAKLAIDNLATPHAIFADAAGDFSYDHGVWEQYGVVYRMGKNSGGFEALVERQTFHIVIRRTGDKSFILEKLDYANPPVM